MKKLVARWTKDIGHQAVNLKTQDHWLKALDIRAVKDTRPLDQRLWT